MAAVSVLLDTGLTQDFVAVKILVALLVGLHGVQGDLVCSEKEGHDAFGKGGVLFGKLIDPEDNPGRISVGMRLRERGDSGKYRQQGE